MKKLLNKPWFVAALAAIALLLVGRSALPWLRVAQGAGADVVADAGPDGAAPGTARPSIEAALQAVPLQSPARDPFAVPAREAAGAAAEAVPDAVETVTLAALWTQQGATLVLINGRIFQAGDAIGRLRIESASQDGVWVRHWKGRDFIALGRTFTLATPAGRASPAAPL